MRIDSFHHPFSLQDRQAFIREIQSFLYECSLCDRFSVCHVLQDGVYGEETRRAVTEFQKAEGLPETGAVDKKTFDLLCREACRARSARMPISPFPSGEQKTLSRGCEGGDVMSLHGILTELSVFYPEIPAFSSDSLSVFHDDTASAVCIMQKHFSLPETGSADCSLYERLCLELRARKEIDRMRKSE